MGMLFPSLFSVIATVPNNINLSTIDKKKKKGQIDYVEPVRYTVYIFHSFYR